MDHLRLILIILGVVLIAGIYLWGTLRRRRPARGERERDRDMDAPFLERFELPHGDPDSERIDPLMEPGDELAGRSPEEGEPPELREEVPGAGLRAPGESAPLAGERKLTEQEFTEPLGQERSAAEPSEASPERALGPPEYSGHELIVALTVMARPGRRLGGGELKHAFEAEGLRYGEMGIFHHYGERGERTIRPVFSAANVLKPGTLDVGQLETFSTPGILLFAQVPGELEGHTSFETMLSVGRRLAGRLDAILCDDARNILTNQSINHLRERIADFERRQMLRMH
ncbi:MAG: cell division protein ZipA [Gammaproteobacteria bacterium]|nr:cell division protein ZipA [Gammaproteobacteria bacterium]NIR82487.1 cell division protein ZipA [Gammaproteobacteria bacterium]NIR88483.1 cell division protein ZipA [Gammaproteobacteria bacterium]NIU03623.1 cell division protein ZipA [Gammaproteobacteria bacterium]NIV50975.1 cell division protein ZipA [Gammaproteobacteria bacterium]